MSTILGRLLNYLLVPLHTRVFSTAEYGVVTEMYSYVTFFVVILSYGMETAFFRFSQKEEDKGKVYSTALISIMITSLVFMIGMSAFSQQIASSIRYPDHPEYITYFAIILGMDAIASIPFALLRQQGRPIKFAIVKNINIFSNILLNLYFLMLCPYMLHHSGTVLPFYRPEIGIAYIFISHLVASVITIPLLFAEIVQVARGFDTALWKRMLAYGLPLLVVGLGGMVNETLDRAIMKYMLPPGEATMSQVGIYGGCYKLAILMSLFIQAFRFAAEPFFFSHAKNSDQKTIYAQVMDYFVLVCLVIFLMVTLYIDLFKLLIDKSYYEGLKVVPVLLLANLCLGVYYNLNIWYKLSDQTNKGAVISLIGAAITILLNVWWIPIFGYMGSAWATLICYFSMMVMCYVSGLRHYPIPYHVKRLLGFTLLALVLFAAGAAGRHFLLPVNMTVMYLVNTVLFLIFGAAVYRFVKSDKLLTSRS